MVETSLLGVRGKNSVCFQRQGELACVVQQLLGGMLALDSLTGVFSVLFSDYVCLCLSLF